VADFGAVHAAGCGDWRSCKGGICEYGAWCATQCNWINTKTPAGTFAIAYADGSTLRVKGEQEMRAAIDVCALPMWLKLLEHVKGAYEYLENRLTDNCAATYGCKEQHRITGLLRAFNPAFARGKINNRWVQDLANLPPFSHLPVDDLQDELPHYLAACARTTIDQSDVKMFSNAVLDWWVTHHSCFPTWALAARIALCLSPNSAACERVFSLLAHMFPSVRDSSLGDQVCASLMLRFNRNQRQRERE